MRTWHLLLLLLVSMCSAQAPCTADSPQAWIKCAALYNQGQASLIAVASLIECDGDSCAATFNTQPSSLLIYASAAGAGFAISGAYKNSIISAQSATNITIQGLLFEHDCWITTYNNSAGCSPTIGLYNCESILIEGCAFESPNPWAISVWHTSFSVIANCTFRNGSMYEVWFDDEPDPAPNPVVGNIVEGCTFEDSWVEALHYHGRSTVEFPGIIRNNYFRHNQFNPIFYTCGPNGDGLCGGGQFSLNVPCTNVVVENNIFTGGLIEGHGAGYLGIEIGSQSLMNITIRENVIYNNSGAAVVVDADPSTSENYTYTITILRNEVWANGAGLVPEFQAGGAVFTDNCMSPSSQCTFGPNAGPSYGAHLTNGGVVTSYSPWAVWLQGSNLNGATSLTARVYDDDLFTLWGVGITLATSSNGVSFQLPSDSPPSGCNAAGACQIGVALADETSGFLSNIIALTIPQQT